MTRLLLTVVAMSLLAGCGSDARRPTSAARTAPAQTGPSYGAPTPPGSPLDEPFGKLLWAEKAAIVREYRGLQRVQRERSSRSLTDRGRRVCAQLTSPRTTLMLFVRMDCDNAVSYLSALQGISHAARDCHGGTKPQELSCLSDRFGLIRISIDQTAHNAKRVNSELYRRGISGLCARSIGITRSQLASFNRVARAANAASNALNIADRSALLRATRTLSTALRHTGGADPLVGIVRGCPTTKPPPRAPAPRGIGA